MITIRLIVLAGLLVTPAFGVFVELEPFGMGHNKGLAWGDYDDDGDLDLAIAKGSNARNVIWRNEGADSFTSLSPFPQHPGPGGASSVVFGDYDNDGDLDIAESRFNNLQNRLHRNEGNDSFTTLDRFGVGVSLEAVWVDHDNDGDLDVAVVNWDGQQNRLYRNDGGDVFTGLDRFGSDWSIGCAWGDYDNDGDVDLAVANDGSRQNKLYRNDGNDQFTAIDAFGTGCSHGCAWGDYDNDGDLDLAVSNDDAQKCYVYRNDGGDVFHEIPIGANGYYAGIVWGDYDNDGDLDLAVSAYYVNQQNKLFRNDGNDVFTELDEFGTGRSMALAWADYDNDGDLDLALLNERPPETNRLYRNDLGNGNHWLKIRLVGVQSNRSGIGARAEVFAGSLSHVREVNGGNGKKSQDGLILHFGLDTAATVDTVRVRWPSGAIDVLYDVAVDRMLTIEEGGASITEYQPPAIPAPIALAVSPSLFRAACRIHAPAGSEIRVFDVLGNTVARFSLTTDRVTWEPDESIRSGVYMVRLVSGSTRRTAKVTLER